MKSTEGQEAQVAQLKAATGLPAAESATSVQEAQVAQLKAAMG